MAAARKHPPPSGRTGYRGRGPTETELAIEDWTGNIALRLPYGVVGVDVDVYHGSAEGLVELSAPHSARSRMTTRRPQQATVWSPAHSATST